MTRRKSNEAVIKALREQVQKSLDGGDREVILDVKGLTLKERNRIRAASGRWGRLHGKVVSVHFDHDRWTLTVTVQGPREGVNESDSTEAQVSEHARPEEEDGAGTRLHEAEDQGHRVPNPDHRW